MKVDTITIEVLADGTIKTTTPKISGANHQSADAFLKAVEGHLGGPTEARRRVDVGTSLTSALHEHTHDGHSHSH